MDAIKRGSIFLFFGGVLGYLSYLFSQNIIIIQDGINAQWNFISYLVLAIICLYFIILYAIKPTYFKRAKLLNAILGIATILIGHKLLINNITTKLYVGDIITVVGVILTLLSFSNVLILKKTKQQKEESEIEVIEV